MIKKRKVNTQDNYLRKTYGLTLAQCNRMNEMNDGLCWICGAKPKSRRLHVDHDHKTGRVRGLLCWHCNSGLKWFRDNEDFVASAVNYLKDTAFDGRNL